VFPAKPIENIRWKNKLLGKRHAVCRECYARRSNDWYKANRDSHIQNVMANKNADRVRARQFIADYLSTHPCVDCKETDPVVLEFDHIKRKNAAIARMVADGVTIIGYREKLISVRFGAGIVIPEKLQRKGDSSEDKQNPLASYVWVNGTHTQLLKWVCRYRQIHS